MEELKNLLSKVIGTKYDSMSDKNIVNDKARLQNLLGKENSDKFMDNVLAFNSDTNTSGAWKDKLQSFLGTSGDNKNDPEPAPKGKIPLPDYKNPQSRLKYAEAWRQKYGPYMQGRGDTPLRINEVPNTQFDRLPVKQSSINAAKRLGLDPSLLYASAMEEGVSGMFKKGYEGEGYFNSSSYENFPVSGFAGVGLDNFADAFKGLVKKGYLPADFEKKFQRTIMTNEKGQETHSGDFRSVEDVFQAKAAMVKDSEDQVLNYAKKNNIPLSPNAKQFFTLINYNAGEGNAQKMLQDYYKAGALKDDAFLKSRPTKGGNLKDASWKQPYDNVMRRWKMSEALKNEGYFN